MTDRKEEKPEVAHGTEKPRARRPLLKRLLLIVPLLALALVGLGFLSVYSISPAPIRNPQMEHLHFRMQLSVDGRDIDFSQADFQTPYAKDQCSADLSAEPIHFHDKKGQFVHIHWANMTGGLVLKNYGWNFVGGRHNILGYRTDDMPRAKAVLIHGDILPGIPSDAKFWVYTGDEDDYKARSFDDFKNRTVEEFFGKQSNFPKASQAVSLMARLFPKASAHGSENHGATLSVGDETEEERLTRINNLIGNVVIFVQQSEPSDVQIKAKFANLAPLSDSTCGG